MANLVSHSSSIGSCWVHLSFKVKYCHRIFDIPDIKNRTEQLLREAMDQYHILYRELGIDRDHIHFVLDLGIRSVDQIAKLLEGYTAKHLLREYPRLKTQYFWDSGLWNPSYYFDSLSRDIEELSTYVRKQGLPRDQRTVSKFITN
jgi:REP element-mobilizing transposase RayT